MSVRREQVRGRPLNAPSQHVCWQGNASQVRWWQRRPQQNGRRINQRIGSMGDLLHPRGQRRGRRRKGRRRNGTGLLRERRGAGGARARDCRSIQDPQEHQCSGIFCLYSPIPRVQGATTAPATYQACSPTSNDSLCRQAKRGLQERQECRPTQPFLRPQPVPNPITHR